MGLESGDEEAIAKATEDMEELWDRMSYEMPDERERSIQKWMNGIDTDEEDEGRKTDTAGLQKEKDILLKKRQDNTRQAELEYDALNGAEEPDVSYHEDKLNSELFVKAGDGTIHSLQWILGAEDVDEFNPYDALEDEYALKDAA